MIGRGESWLPMAGGSVIACASFYADESRSDASSRAVHQVRVCLRASSAVRRLDAKSRMGLG